MKGVLGFGLLFWSSKVFISSFAAIAVVRMHLMIGNSSDDNAIIFSGLGFLVSNLLLSQRLFNVFRLIATTQKLF